MSPNYLELYRHVEDLPLIAQVTQSRAGSDLFHSLLDSHPEVLQQPGSFDYVAFWKAIPNSISTRLLGRYLTCAGETDKLQLAKFESSLNTSERWHQLGITRNQSFSVDIDKFEEHFQGFMEHALDEPLSRRLFLAYHCAYAVASGMNLSECKVIFFHLHTPEQLSEFCKLISVDSVILNRRHPASGVASQIDHDIRKLEQGERAAGTLAGTYFLKRESALSLGSHLTNLPLRCVWLENLHERPELEMRDIAAFLGISFLPLMMESTWGGLLWWGDAQSGQDLQGVSPARGMRLRTESFGIHTAGEIAIYERLCVQKKLGLPPELFTQNRRSWLAYFLVNLSPTTYEKRILQLELRSAIPFTALLKVCLKSFFFYLKRVSNESRVLMGFRS